jgi:hypothetical protein
MGARNTTRTEQIATSLARPLANIVRATAERDGITPSAAIARFVERGIVASMSESL